MKEQIKAPPHLPGSSELPQAESISESAKTSTTKSKKKPWHGVKLAPGYEIDTQGTYIVTEVETDEGEPQKRKQKFAGPIWVVAGTRDGHGSAWGAVVQWLDRDNKLHERAISAKRFHEKNNSLAQDLADEGLRITPGKEQILNRYLEDYQASERWGSAAQLGWLETLDAELAYVLPKRTFSKSTNRVIFQPEKHSPSTSSIHEAGSLNDWKKKVCEVVAQEPYFLFCVAMAFAGPLQKHARVESGGFHLVQRTTRGKTTTLQCAASVWGCGADPTDAPSRAFVRSWNTTLAAVEALASSHNDCILVCDELGKCDDRAFGQLVYDLFGGQGKSRLNPDASARKQRVWRTLVLSAGEESVREKLKRSGDVKGGQMVRFCDIIIEDSLVLSKEDAATFTRTLKQSCSEFYGTAGPEFLRRLIAHFKSSTTLTEYLNDTVETTIQRLLPAKYSPEVRRLCARFALVEVAGKMANSLLDLPVTDEQIETSVKFVWDRCVIEAAEISDDKRAISKIRESIVKNPSRYLDVNESDIRISPVLGYFESTPTGRIYYFTPEQLAEASGQDPKMTARALKEKGLLRQNNGINLTSRKTINLLGDRRINVYAVDGKIVGTDGGGIDAPFADEEIQLDLVS